MTGRQRGTPAGKDGINVIPGQQGTIHATCHIGLITTLLEGGGHTRYGPLLGVTQIDIRLGILKVVNIRGIVLRTTSRTCYQLGELTRKRDIRGLLHVQEWNLVQHRGEPLTLLFPVHVQSPYGITQGFRSHRHLRGLRLFV